MSEQRNWGDSDNPLTEAEAKALPATNSGEIYEPRRVRAKFRVVRHEQAEGNVYHPATDKYGAGVWHAVVLQAVSGNSEENKQFYAATPNGEIRMSMVRAETAALFPIGAEIYVDFTPAE